MTGLSNLDLLGERPLSVVLKEFLQWVEATVHEVSRHTGEEYFPVDSGSDTASPVSEPDYDSMSPVTGPTADSTRSGWFWCLGGWLWDRCLEGWLWDRCLEGWLWDRCLGGWLWDRCLGGWLWDRCLGGWLFVQDYDNYLRYDSFCVCYLLCCKVPISSLLPSLPSFSIYSLKA